MAVGSLRKPQLPTMMQERVTQLLAFRLRGSIFPHFHSSFIDIILTANTRSMASLISCSISSLRVTDMVSWLSVKLAPIQATAFPRSALCYASRYPIIRKAMMKMVITTWTTSTLQDYLSTLTTSLETHHNKRQTFLKPTSILHYQHNRRLMSTTSRINPTEIGANIAYKAKTNHNIIHAEDRRNRALHKSTTSLSDILDWLSIDNPVREAILVRLGCTANQHPRVLASLTTPCMKGNPPTTAMLSQAGFVGLLARLVCGRPPDAPAVALPPVPQLPPTVTTAATPSENTVKLAAVADQWQEGEAVVMTTQEVQAC
eukprot:3822375-Amphidinium_carterae.2